MELTRRDAAAALAALGITSGAALGVRQWTDDEDDTEDQLPSESRTRTVMVAVAEIVYPDAVSGVETFVEAFLDGRFDVEEHAEGLRTTVGELEYRAESWYGDGVAELPTDDRDRLLRDVGADTAEESPDGTVAERVRYYVLNDLLLALYASPTGGELVGIENPQGHAGGIETYRRGPDA